MSAKKSSSKQHKQKNPAPVRSAVTKPVEKAVRVPEHYFDDNYFGVTYVRTVASERLANAIVLE